MTEFSAPRDRAEKEICTHAPIKAPPVFCDSSDLMRRGNQSSARFLFRAAPPTPKRAHEGSLCTPHTTPARPFFPYHENLKVGPIIGLWLNVSPPRLFMIAAFDVLHSASSRREQRRKYFETLFFPSRNRKAAPTVAFALLTQRPPCSFFFWGRA